MGKRIAVRPELVYAAALVAAVMATYWPLHTYPFLNFDDNIYVTNNPWVRAGLTREGLVWAWKSLDFNWHPLTWLSHMTDATLYGLRAGGHHYTNLLLHAANTALLFAVLLRLTGRRGRSAVVAAWFGLHPLHVEPVAWISARKDVLSTLFWLLTMWAYARYTERTTVTRYLVVMAFFALGLMSKAMLVTLPCVLLLMDYWPLGRWAPISGGRTAARRPPGPWRSVIEKLPLLGLSAATGAVTVLAEVRMGALASLPAWPLGKRAATALVAYVGYLRKAFWPTDLAVLYPHAQGDLPARQALTAALVLVLISAAALRLRSRRPYLLVGWLWYLGTLVPVIGIVQIGQQAMADRYTYVPLVGIFLIVAWGADELLDRLGVSRGIRAALAAASVSVLAFAAHVQVGYWQSNEELFRHALAVTKNNYVAHTNLAAALADRGAFEAARHEYDRALRLAPHDAVIHRSAGFAFEQAGRLDEAAAHFKESLRTEPDNPRARYGLASVWNRQGKREEAVAELRAALASSPRDVAARRFLAELLLAGGNPREALVQARLSVGISPYDPTARNALGVALASVGKTDEAIAEFEKAVRLDPELRLARQNLRLARQQRRKRRSR